MRLVRAFVFFVLVLSVASAALAAGGTIRELTIQSEAIAGNLLGDPAEQKFAVYVPPGYDDSATARYPVLYLLHGIGGGYTDWTEQWGIRETMDALIAAGAPPFLVVMPNGRNAFGGAFYADSPVTGKWETFLVRELVPRIDRDFRTIARPGARGIAGHSMGGFGAIRLAMRYPELFGSLFAMAPCCLEMVDDISYGNQDWHATLDFKSPEDIGRSIQARKFYPVAILALSVVLSPNPDKPPFFADYPVRRVNGELMPDDKVTEAWRKQFPIEELPSRRENLMRLRAIYLDYGTFDQFAHIPTGTADFSRELARLRIPHTLEVYSGDHRQEIPKRLRAVVLPFFARNLER